MQASLDQFGCISVWLPIKNRILKKVGLTTIAFAAQFPGLNGLGLSMARADSAVGGVAKSYLSSSYAFLISLFRNTVKSKICGFFSVIFFNFV